MDNEGNQDPGALASNLGSEKLHKRKHSEDSDESLRDEDSIGLSDVDLDEFLKNAEHLSDQTLGDIRLYDCSLTTDIDKSSSHHHSFHDGSDSILRNFCDLSCSMLVDGDKSLSISKVDLKQAVKHFDEELQKKNKVIEELCSALNAACDAQKGEASKTKDLVSQVSWISENRSGIADLTACSCGEKSEISNAESFRLSTYISALRTQTSSDLLEKAEQKSAQTSPIPFPCSPKPDISKEELVVSLCHSFMSTAQSLKDDLSVVRRLIKQPFENHSDFPIQKITSGLTKITQYHENEVSALNHKLTTDARHHQELQNGLKDEIKTLKMRLQEKLKQKDHEISDLKARLLEVDDVGENGENKNAKVEDICQPSFDDSFSSNPDEETFSNLTRTKVEYLKLTPSEYVEDEVIDTVHIPDSYRQILDDYKLKLFDMEKKFDANKRYLDEQTHDREVERDEFQQALGTLQCQIEDLKKENGKLYEVNKQNLYQTEEYAARLKSAEEGELEIVHKHEKTENELKSAVEKVYELREIIRDLEKQIDSLSGSAIQLKEQNQVLMDELEKQELMSKKEQPIYNEQDTYGTLPMDVTDEIQAQLQDLGKKLEFKLNEMDNFPWHTRPNSSCSGVASAVSTEDISCRDLAGRSSRSYNNFPVEDIGSLLLNEIRRLESQFESLTRFEDVIMKKLKDTELRCSGQKGKIEELENQIAIYLEKSSKQMLKIADLEGQIDNLRFESSNQGIIATLQSRLATACKQLDEYKRVLDSKIRELSQVGTELNALKTQQQQAELKCENKNASSQTAPLFESSMGTTDYTFDGVSPEKIRRLDTGYTLNTSVISVAKPITDKDQNISSTYEQGNEFYHSYNHDQNRVGFNFSHVGGGDSSNNDTRSGASHSHLVNYGIGGDSPGSVEENLGSGPDSPRVMNIQEMERMFQDLQTDILDKDSIIKKLQDQLTKKDGRPGEQECQSHGDDGIDEGCEQENVALDTELQNNSQDCEESSTARSSRRNIKTSKLQVSQNTNDCVYEILVASEYEADGELMKYLGTKMISRESQGNPVDPSQGRGRIQETDRQIEIATLNTQIRQLKRVIDEERKKSEDLTKRLKVCEESKAELRSRSPLTRAPVQNVSSNISVQQMQLRETARQIEEGRELLNAKQLEINGLTDHIEELEALLKTKVTYIHELNNRLSSTTTLLKKCEGHGRELATNNQENVKEIRRLKAQLDKINVNNHNTENYPVVGGDYFDNFMRAKSHKKALAWQKKYLYSVVLGYKSILRQVGHGNEHPDLLQAQVPLAPSAAGLLDRRRPLTLFRIGAITVIAVIRMKYMVNRWHKKMPGEASPDSEYRCSKQSGRFDSSIIRPSRAIAVPSAVNNASHPGTRPATDKRIAAHEFYTTRVDSFGDMSEYLTRFESLENDISSRLGRNAFPS